MQISPSILSADFANLESELGAIGNADWAHVDVTAPAGCVASVVVIPGPSGR